MNQPEIILKWGTLKGWGDVQEGSEAMRLLKKYHEYPVSFGCAAQEDTPEQRQILLDLISLPDVRVYLDWDAKYVTSEEAVQYLTQYGKKKETQ